MAQFIGTELGAKHTGKSPLLKKKDYAEELDAKPEDLEYHTKDEAGKKMAASFSQMVVGGGNAPEGGVLKPSEMKKRNSVAQAPAAAPVAVEEPGQEEEKEEGEDKE